MLFGTSSTFGREMRMIEMGLNADALRREVIADNIANADTPGFKRMEVSFEAQMNRAVDSEREPQFPNLMTNDRHITFNEIIDYRTVEPRLSVAYDQSYRNDENGVDIDREMTDATKNAMHYNALLEVYNRNIRILDIAMR